MPAAPAKVLVADPPWPFQDSLPGKGRGAAKHYELMTIEQLAKFELPSIAPDAVLFMWRVAAIVEEAYQVVREWGFTPKSELVWVKQTPTGKLWFGMGRTVRAAHESCIIATRGKLIRKRADVRSVFFAPASRRHSEKPDAFYDLVEQLYPGPYVELFARRRRRGWTCLGNEL
jgi:N6-adenosine-specific RNA methylase IME4